MVESDLGQWVHHYVVGSGARLDPTMDPSRLPASAHLLFHWPLPSAPLEGGFGSVVICPTTVTVRLYNELGVQKHVHVRLIPTSRYLSMNTQPLSACTGARVWR